MSNQFVAPFCKNLQHVDSGDATGRVFGIRRGWEPAVKTADFLDLKGKIWYYNLTETPKKGPS